MKQSIGAQPLLYPTPVLVVCTFDGVGKPNAMTVAWGGICCSKPPCVSISLRKATYSYHHILERKAFTINIPGDKYLSHADYFGSVSGKNEDKFLTTGLTPVKSTLVDAPYIDEFPMILECHMIHSIEIGLHTQFIGEILDIKADDSCLDSEQVPLIERIRPVLYAPGVRAYYGIGNKLADAYSTKKEKFTEKVVEGKHLK
ncbi:flavin reductase family protein [candidate division KSB1 bacterium]|nr:flavin reductase family protein [candidate division KSB1 bacterium]